jgi:hypothetical protein
LADVFVVLIRPVRYIAGKRPNERLKWIGSRIVTDSIEPPDSELLGRGPGALRDLKKRLMDFLGNIECKPVAHDCGSN